MEALWVAAGILLVGVAVIVLASRARQRAAGATIVERPPPLPPRAIPLVAVPTDEALAALPVPLRACPDCGHVGVRAPELGEGGIPGTSELLGVVMCAHCGYRGPPAEFDATDDYREYVESLRRAWRKRSG